MSRCYLLNYACFVAWGIMVLRLLYICYCWVGLDAFYPVSANVCTVLFWLCAYLGEWLFESVSLKADFILCRHHDAIAILFVIWDIVYAILCTNNVN